jgi:hypothetical protein
LDGRPQHIVQIKLSTDCQFSSFLKRGPQRFMRRAALRELSGNIQINMRQPTFPSRSAGCWMPSDSAAGQIKVDVNRRMLWQLTQRRLRALRVWQG